jgi:hypothetical protein
VKIGGLSNGTSKKIRGIPEPNTVVTRWWGTAGRGKLWYWILLCNRIHQVVLDAEELLKFERQPDPVGSATANRPSVPVQSRARV